jgi:ketosteroid isomerase-like protein
VKQRVIILYLTIALSAFAGACQAGGTNREATTTPATATASPRPPANKATVDEIREVLTAHDKALSDKNLDALMATFSTEANTVVLGTGSEERWMGPQEIRAAYTEIFKDYDPGTMQCTCDWKTGGSDDAGTMAWLAAICNCKDSMKGKAREYKLNVSGTVEKQNGSWRFVSLHMSNAFLPPVTK